MFSGKTTKLIELFHHSEYQEHEKIAVKPLIDDRYTAHKINSHGGLQMLGHRLGKSEEINTLITTDTKIVFFDEIQFFDSNIDKVIRDLIWQEIDVIAAGLDKDYLNRDFGKMPELKSMARNQIQLYAKCSVCAGKASYTYRTLNNEDLILVGHKDAYEARCEMHYLFPEKQSDNL